MFVQSALVNLKCEDQYLRVSTWPLFRRQVHRLTYLRRLRSVSEDISQPWIAFAVLSVRWLFSAINQVVKNDVAILTSGCNTIPRLLLDIPNISGLVSFVQSFGLLRVANENGMQFLAENVKIIFLKTAKNLKHCRERNEQ